MLIFDKIKISQRLEGVHPRSRTLFALGCADQLLPLFQLYCERTESRRYEILESAACMLWDQLASGGIVLVEGFLRSYPSLAPNDDTPYESRTPLDPLAENAVLALGSAWECHVSGEAEKAIWAAEQAYEAVDYLAQATYGISYSDADGERLLLESGLVQSELRRQSDTLTTLERLVGAAPRVDVITAFREQSIAIGQRLKSVAATIKRQFPAK